MLGSWKLILVFLPKTRESRKLFDVEMNVLQFSLLNMSLKLNFIIFLELDSTAEAQFLILVYMCCN